MDFVVARTPFVPTMRRNSGPSTLAQWRRLIFFRAHPPPLAAGVHARRTRGPGGPRIVPHFRDATARVNHAAPCPHTDLAVAGTTCAAHVLDVRLSLCVQAAPSWTGEDVLVASTLCGTRAAGLAALGGDALVRGGGCPLL